MGATSINGVNTQSTSSFLAVVLHPVVFEHVLPVECNTLIRYVVMEKGLCEDVGTSVYDILFLFVHYMFLRSGSSLSLFMTVVVHSKSNEHISVI